MKKIVIAVAVLVVIVGAGAYFLFSNLDSLVKSAIERIGSQVAGVPVRVQSVHIALADGKGVITGLSVANPKGFSTPSVISIDQVTIAIDSASVTKNPVVITAIDVSAPLMTYELAAGGSNIDALKKNVAQGSAASASGGSGSGGRRLVIDRLAIHGGKVNLATPLPGGQASLPLADIVLTGLGRSGGGVSGAEIGSEVLNALSRSALKSVQAIDPTKLLGGAAGSLGSGSDMLGDKLKGLMGK